LSADGTCARDGCRTLANSPPEATPTQALIDGCRALWVETTAACSARALMTKKGVAAIETDQVGI